MNETKEKDGKDKDETKNLNEADGPKCVTNEIEEIVISDDSAEKDYSRSDAPDTAEDENSVLFTQTEDVEHTEEEQREEGEEDVEETQYTNLDELLAVWWEYKRANKMMKKKKKRLVEIFRDENYWTDGRFTDDEDFNYLQA